MGATKAGAFGSHLFKVVVVVVVVVLWFSLVPKWDVLEGSSPTVGP